MYKPLIIEGKADESKKRCYDCHYCQGALSWWCTNEDAIKARGTRKAGIKNCPHWEAATHYEDLSFSEKVLAKSFFSHYIEVKGDKQ